jgi:hypothetical protein
VILGASNVARGIATIADVARETFGSPLEILAAMGHGRSYGLTTSIPFRTLPSVRESGLWKALESRAPLPTWTVLTDIGNDLIYGCQPAQVVEWIEECAARLRGASEQMVVTGLPLSSVQRIGWLRFHLFRSALFPKSTLQLSDAQRYAVELDEAMRQLAARQRAIFAPLEPHWYGVDPIHIRVAVQRTAWRAIFSALAQKNFSPSRALHSPWRQWWRVMTIRPERSRVFFRARQVAQPAVALSDGSTISFY